MTDGRDPGEPAGSGAATRRATVTTTHGDAATAERVAAALDPDNTAEMATGTDGDSVVTTVRRNSTGGLRSTLDDYVVNAAVAARLAASDGTDRETRPTEHSDTSDNSDTTPT